MDYTVNDIYQGSYSSLDPEKAGGFVGYRMPAGDIGMGTDARTANVLKEVSENLNVGGKTVELSQVFPEQFDSIPNEQLEEVNRLSKLTGVDVSVHAPVLEASGLTNEGFSESNREAAERQMTSAVERSHKVNPDGNIPVTFHSSAILPGELTEKGKEIPSSVLIINSDSGSINRLPITSDKKRFPGEDEKITVANELKKRNEEAWSQSITQLSMNIERATEAINHYSDLKELAEAEEKAGKTLGGGQKRAISSFNIGNNYLDDSYRQLKELFEIAYNKADDEDKDVLDEFKNNILGNVEKINNKDVSVSDSIELKKDIVEKGINAFRKLSSSPKIFEPLMDFSKGKTVDTFSNVALNSYKKFKDKAPIISIENPPAGGAFSTGRELKDVVENTRKKFVEKAVEQGVLSEGEAKKQAEKLIGVTWDVGHINMLRKHGYEAKDIIEETKQVAPLVKHVHLSDNFGFEHTELPMGMGNVPIKDIMGELGKEGYKGKKIVEALNWWQHFSPGGKQNPPLKPTLQAFGSGIYSMEMAPYWNQSLGFEQSYSSGFGEMIPQGHFGTFGGGFSGMPMEVGGQRAQPGGRVSGRPME